MTLHHCKQLLHTIADYGESVIACLDSQGRFSFVNSEVTSVVGYQPEEWLNQSITTFLTEKASEEWVTHFQEYLHQLHLHESNTLQIDFIHKDNRVVPVQMQLHRLASIGTSPESIYILFRDIGPLRQAQDTILLMQELAENAQKVARIGFWQSDLVTGNLVWSSGMFTIFQVSIEDFPGRRDYAYQQVLPEDLNRLSSTVREAIDSKKGYSIEHRIRDRKGTIRWILEEGQVVTDAYGNVHKLVGTSQDITDRKATEAQLNEAHERMRMISENSLDAFALHDTQRFLAVNNAFLDMFGYTWNELQTIKPRDVVCEEQQEQLHARFARKAEGTFEYDWLRKDGKTFRGEVRIQLVPLHGRDVRAASIRDISERLHLQEQVRQSQKMEAIGTLAGGIAHDFNNLLTVITGYVNLLLKKTEADPAIHTPLQEVHRATLHASHITSSLLAFSRKQVVQPQVLELNQYLRENETILSRFLGNGVEMSIDYTSHRTWILIDPGQLQQLFMNLIINARDAMPTGGDLRIRYGIEDEVANTDVPTPAGSTGNTVLIQVSDTGHGIPEEIRETIFEPFFTTKEVGKGTGLGLPTVNGIVQENHGRIEIESVIDKGTTFSIHFPEQAHVQPGSESKTLPFDSSGEPCSETILVIEDAPSIRDLVKLSLSPEGYTVLPAEDGNQALQLGKTHSGSIELAIMDFQVPGVKGKQLVDGLREQKPQLKFLFMSGYISTEFDGYGMKPGEYEILRKPFTPDALIEIVQLLLRSEVSS